MNEKPDLIALAVPLGTIGGIVALAIIGHITESRRLKKEGKSLRMQEEANKINRETARWMHTDGLKLGFADFGTQLNERLDFAIFIRNH